VGTRRPEADILGEALHVHLWGWEGRSTPPAHSKSSTPRLLTPGLLFGTLFTSHGLGDGGDNHNNDSNLSGGHVQESDQVQHANFIPEGKKGRKEGRKESQNATVVSSDETCGEPSNICVFPFSW